MGLDPEQCGEWRAESAQRGEKSRLADAFAQVDGQCCLVEMGSLRFSLESRLQGQHGGSEEAQQAKGCDLPPGHNSRPEKTSAASAE